MWGDAGRGFHDLDIPVNGATNPHENPNLSCCTDGRFAGTTAESYSLSEGQWTHILISYDGSKQRIYFNGKKTGEYERPKLSYRQVNGGSITVSKAPIYIGGSRVY